MPSMFVFVVEGSIGFFFRLGFNIALTHQNRSYRDSETKENVEAQKRKQRGEKTGRGQRQLRSSCLVSSLQPVRLEYPSHAGT